MKFKRFHRRRLFAGLLAFGIFRVLTSSARAQGMPGFNGFFFDDLLLGSPPPAGPLESQWLRFNGPLQASTGVEVDTSTEKINVGGTSSTYDHLFVTPTVGLRTSGSIYHPDLLSFDANSEWGWGWDKMRVSSGGSTSSVNESGDLLRYMVQGTLLEAKPYNATFFANQDHTFRDYGSFDTFQVDSSRYGGHFGWDALTFNLNVDAGYRDEQDTGFNDSSEVKETYFNFTGIQRRQFGLTTLTYRLDNFDNTVNGGSQISTINQSLGLSDSETFGSRRQFSAATAADYSQSEYSGQRTETVSGNENINANLRPNLDSFLLVNGSHTELSPVESDSAQGTAGLRHQLYESLVSRFDVHGSFQNASSPSGDTSSDLYGVGLSENYSKRIQSWGRLSIGAGGVGDHEDDSSTGGVLSIFNEPHQIYLPTSASYHPVYLSEPDVNAASIQVSVGGQPLTVGIDYLVVPSGQLTEIRLVDPPSATVAPLLQGPGHDNLNVTVTYQSTAPQNASFDSLNATAQIRLDLFGKFGIYGRMNWMDNNAPPEALTQTLTDLVGGVDYNWRWFRDGAEYEDYDSNFSQYQAWRFYQDFNFQPGVVSTLSVNLSQSFYQYPDDRNQDQYLMLTRYNVRLLNSLSWFVEGGGSWQDALGTQEWQSSARTGLTWSRGKLSVRSGYEFNDQNISSGTWTEERVKNRLYFYLKRTF